MNKIYRVIWNKQLACWQAVSELAKSHSSTTQKAAASETESSVCHSLSSVSTWMRSILFFSVAMLPFSIHAAISSTELPTGAQINSGSASFNQTGNTLNINQNSQNLSTHWNTFNIGQDATVNFNQPNQSSTAINHVLDSNASQIMGRLNANGQVFLLNPNGVVFSKTAQVNVGGLVASTLNLSDADIQNGKYTLKGDANSTASIENQGSIQTLQGGTVALIAPNVKNTGTISTPNGTTHLTSASQVTLALQDGSLTQYQVDQGVLQGLVDNGGAIIADNGAVYLTAKAKDSLSKAVVNHSGIIEANRLSQNAKGEIILLGDMQSGETHVSGTLKAEGKNGADGGFIETSAAKVNIDKEIKISTLSDGGKTGNWLIDPYNVVISNTADSGTGFTATQDDTVINATTLMTALATTGVTVSTGGTGVGTQDGNITVDADLSWTSNSTLTLQADKDIQLNKKITAQNGGLTLNAANNISATDAINVGTFTLSKGNWLQNTATLPGFYAKDFRLNGGSFIRALGGDGSTANPWQLTDIYGVQGMGTKLNGNFALANDIDASGTVNWNSGAGFNPIGNSSTTAFTGVLDGLGHTVSNLFINRPSNDYVGLFGYSLGSTIQNIGLLGGTVTGGWYTGGLVGSNGGVISNVYTTGSVKSETISFKPSIAGGVVGNNSGTIRSAFATGDVTANISLLSDYYAISGGLVGWNSGRISDVYATGVITADTSASSLSYRVANPGGLVGYNANGTISNAYAIGGVRATSPNSSSFAGGLVGYTPGGIINNAYWNKETTGQSTSAGGIGLTTAQMFDKSNFTGFDFSSVWGNANNQTTPYLLNLANNQVFNKNDLPSGTINTTNRPALYTAILNVNQLQDMNKNLSGKYLLGNNIDASDTVNWNSGAGFKQIVSFTGTLDGLGHTINNLTINRPSEWGVGLIGSGSNITIQNLGIVNANVSGAWSSGVLAGFLEGNNLIKNVYTTGSFNGCSTGFCGSLVGALTNSGTISILNSFSNANLNIGSSTYGYIGGLMGGMTYAQTAVINNSYYSGSIDSQANNIGGVIGGINNNGVSLEINNSYVTGNIKGLVNIGSLVGDGNTLTNINNSFWNNETTGQTLAIGNNSGTLANVTGLTTAQMQDLNIFKNAGWDIDGVGGTGKIWRIYDGQTAPLLRSFLTSLTITNDDTTTTYNGKNQGGGYQVVPAGTIYDPALILSQQKNVTPSAVTIDLNKDLYSIQQGYDLIVQASSGTGTLKIDPATLLITANDAGKTYGETKTFNGTEFSASGLQNGETVGQVSLSSTGSAATAGVNGGAAYAIIASNATGGTFDANNYTISYSNGNL
ncbi:filamentous hemagglutinin N-terminal domain-containing protein, partial [Acinetobacter kookii]